MDFQRIHEQLNNEFKVDHRQIIFWYDENKEFQEDIKDLVLDNAKVLILSGNDYFKVKYLLEIEDTDSNYLLYAPFVKPDDHDNPLLDTLLYSKTFYADYYSLLADELGISKKLVNHLRKYDKFFNNKTRKKAFASLNEECKSISDIDLCVLAVCTKTKVKNFDEILKNVFIKGLKDNKLIKDIETFGSIEVFWEYVSKYYGYADENPTLHKFMVQLFVTHMSGITEELPQSLQQYELPRKAEASLFIDNLKNNNKTSNVFDELSETIAQSLNIKNIISKMDIEDIKNNDVFKEFDEQYIQQLINYAMQSTNYDKFEMYINIRENTHYYDVYKDVYEALKYAFYLIKDINQFKQFCHSVTISDYTDKYANIDKYYHLYVYHYDKMHRDGFKELNNYVENKYNNEYLGPINMMWDKQLLENKEKDPRIILQHDFYRRVIGSKWEKEKTCVIISDALRYEAGLQLYEKLAKEAKYSPEMKYMISTIPSYTQLGMAAMLPNYGIEINNDGSITINGHKTNGIENRHAILNKYNEHAKALQFDYLKNIRDRNELRKELKDVRLLYVYHNQIDARGDHALTENEVFDAAQEGINEIETMMRRLCNETNFTKFVITADHGFIYRRKDIEESDKIDIVDDDNIFKNKRFIYSNHEINQNGAIEFDTKYLDNKNTMKVYVPKGGNIFKAKGGGQHFVHGGASLQEIVVPLIEVKTTARKVATEKVTIELMPCNNKITNLSARFIFIQVDFISDVMKERSFTIYFIDEDGNVISNKVNIRANIVSDNVNDRMFNESFNFINKKYDSRKNYYMIIEDEEGIEFKRYSFIFDLAFADDFDFDF